MAYRGKEFQVPEPRSVRRNGRLGVRAFDTGGSERATQAGTASLAMARAMASATLMPSTAAEKMPPA